MKTLYSICRSGLKRIGRTRKRWDENIGDRQRRVAHDFVEFPVVVVSSDIVRWDWRKTRQVDQGEKGIFRRVNRRQWRHVSNDVGFLHGNVGERSWRRTKGL